MAFCAFTLAATLPLASFSWFCGQTACASATLSLPKSACASPPWVVGADTLPVRARDGGSLWTVPPLSDLQLAVVDAQSGRPVASGWIEVVDAPPPTLRQNWVQKNQWLSWKAALPLRVRLGAEGYKTKEFTWAQASMTVVLEREQVLTWRLAGGGPGEACVAPWAELGTFAPFSAKALCVQAEKEGILKIPAPAGAAVVVVRSPGCEPHVVRGTPPQNYLVPCAPGVTLTVHVQDAQKEDVANAKVTVTARVPGMGNFPYESACTTAASGVCTVKGLAEGKVKVRVAAQGKAAWEQELVIPQGEPITVTLQPGWDLRGRVLAFDGEAVVEASVRGHGAEAKTSPSGEFLLEGLPWELVTVAAQAKGFVPATVAVEPGTQQVILRLQRGTRLEWPVVGDLWEGVFAEAALVENGETLQVFAGSVTEKPATVWWEGLPPGTYRVEVRVPGFTPLATEARISEAGGVVRLPEARLDAGLSFWGRVVAKASGQGVVGARVRAEPGDPAEFRLPHEVIHAGQTLTRADGTFTLTGLQKRRYRLVVEAPNFAPLLLSGLEPEPGGADLGTLELSHGFFLRVHVVDAQLHPRPWAPVEVGEGKAYEYEPLFRGVANEKGTVEFPHVPPGRWRLVVTAPGCEKEQWAEGEEGEEKAVTVSCRHPRVRGTVLVGGVPVAGGEVVFAPPHVPPRGPVVMVHRPGEKPRFFGLNATGMAAPVTDEGTFVLEPAQAGTWQVRWVLGQRSTSPLSVFVPEEGESTVVLDFPGGALCGRVKDENGAGLPEVAVEVMRASGEVLAGGETDSTGYFHLAGMVAGALGVQARREGYAPGRVQVVVPERGTVEVEIVLRPQARTGLKGKVVSPGAGVAGAPVVLCGSAARTVYANADGSFELFGLQPGQYQVCAKAYGGPVGCTSAVTLREQETRLVELSLEGQAWIREELDPTPDAALGLLSELSCPLAWLLPAPSWERGNLVWGPLLPGTYTLVTPSGLKRLVRAR